MLQNIFFVVGTVYWVGAWHIPALACFRWRWEDNFDRRFAFSIFGWCVASLASDLLFLHPSYVVTWKDGLSVLAVGYSIWRTWREHHKPPRRRLRDRVSELGKKLSERITITPVRVPLPVGA